VIACRVTTLSNFGDDDDDDYGSEENFPTFSSLLFFIIKIVCQLDAEWNIMFLSLFIKDGDDDWSVYMYID
jgi:hypothetical protein